MVAATDSIAVLAISAASAVPGLAFVTLTLSVMAVGAGEASLTVQRKRVGAVACVADQIVRAHDYSHRSIM
jgi:hypothetical protein